MDHMIRMFVALAGAAIVPWATAQGPGTGVTSGGTEVRLLVNPRAMVRTKVDGELVQQGTIGIRLDPGPHRLSFWAPGFALLDTMVQVGADTLYFRRTLREDPEHRAHREAWGRAKSGRTLWRYGTAAAFVGTGVWAALAHKGMRDAHRSLEDAETEYAAALSPDAIVSLKEVEIPERKETFADRRTGFTIAATVAGVCLASTVFGWIRAGQIDDPPPFEDKEKVRFDGIALIPSIDPQGPWMATLNLRLP
ncbi:MAG: hypothetical protein IPM46_00055 [Flavobacteriales bacterium]|nr:hypothetical protein [Flavobacteriales bacterium]